MRLKHKALIATVAFMMIAATAAEAVTSAQINRQFRNAVSQVLNSVRSEQPALAEMSGSEFRAFVSCAQNVMDDAPLARKQYVLAARGINARRQRFDEVALDNRAELKQRVTRECYY